jgi:hypothetical protein
LAAAKIIVAAGYHLHKIVKGTVEEMPTQQVLEGSQYHCSHRYFPWLLPFRAWVCVPHFLEFGTNTSEIINLARQECQFIFKVLFPCNDNMRDLAEIRNGGQKDTIDVLVYSLDGLTVLKPSRGKSVPFS